MKPAVTFPDPEALVVPVLTDLLAAYGSDATVSVGMPDNWDPDADPLHVEVAWDGTPDVSWPLVAWPLVRLVVHGPNPSPVTELVGIASGLLASSSDLSWRPQLFPPPAQDPQRTGVHLAAITGRLTTRSQPIDLTGS